MPSGLRAEGLPGASPRGAACSLSRAAARQRGGVTAMHQRAPAPIVVATRLRAPREKRLCAHHGIVGAVPRGRVRRTPADVEDLAAWVGVRLTVGAVGTSDSGGVG